MVSRDAVSVPVPCRSVWALGLSSVSSLRRELAVQPAAGGVPARHSPAADLPPAAVPQPAELRRAAARLW